MSVEAIGVITLVLGLLALWRGEQFAICVFLPSMLMGSAAAITITAVGASIQPAHVLLGFLALTILSKKAGLRRAGLAATFPREGYWLLCTLVYGVIGAFFYPRLMAGHILVNAIGASAYGVSFTPVPFGPTSGNITQSIYFAGDTVCFLACSSFAASPSGVQTLARGLLIYCVTNILFAGLDLLTFWTGTTFLLDFMRNASYTIFTDATVGNLKRIIGSFTEASSFAYATLGSFAFTLRLWLDGVRPRQMAGLTLISLMLLFLSTSSTAYVALPVYFGALYCRLLWRFLSGRAQALEALTVIVLPLILVVAVSAVMLVPAANAQLSDFLDVMLWQKSTSESGIERSRYNAEAFKNFVDTLGLGTGVGSVRASSFLVAVLANLGVVGGLTYGVFITLVILRRPPADAGSFERSVKSAARAACTVLLIASSVSGALIDLGLPFFVFAALATGRQFQTRLVRPAAGEGPTTAPIPLAATVPGHT